MSNDSLLFEGTKKKQKVLANFKLPADWRVKHKIRIVRLSVNKGLYEIINDWWRAQRGQCEILSETPRSGGEFNFAQALLGHLFGAFRKVHNCEKLHHRSKGLNTAYHTYTASLS